MASGKIWRASSVVSALVVLLLICSATEAAIGDRPLTQLANEESLWTFDASSVPTQLMTGVWVDSDGIMFATWNDGVMRVPPALAAGGPSVSVTAYTVPFLPTATIFNPCITNAASPTSPFYTCLQPGQEYIGDFTALYYRAQQLGGGFGLPWTHEDRLYVITRTPAASIVQFDKATFSIRDVSYNRIEQPSKLTGAMKVFYDGTNAFVACNAENGNSLIVRIPMATITDTSTWVIKTFLGSTIIDIDWDPSHSTFYILGRTSTIENGVWSSSATAGFPSSTTPSVVSTNVPTCANTGTTIAFDVDAGPRGNRIYVGCTGTLSTFGTIEALNPTTFAQLNYTLLDDQDDLFTTWVHDQTSGIIYIGTQGRASGAGTYSGVIQYSTTDDRRDGRAETVLPFKVTAMALSPLKVPAGHARAGAPYFYVVGQQTIEQNPAVGRWESAQACLNYCGETADPVRGSCVRRSCTCTAFVDPVTSQPLAWQQPWCSTLDCPFNCNGQGSCVNATCSCDRDWTTTDPLSPCTTRRCPNDCLGDTHGTCNYNATGYPTGCTCTAGWSGDDCATKTKLPCEMLTANCSICVDNTACIWCASSRTCMYGDINGPSGPLKNAECRSYFWGSCPSVAIDIVNYLMTAILGVCLVISFASGTIIDTSSEVPERRTEWYLFQRAGKIWSMIYQLQLIAVAGLINIAYPTSFSGFLRYWNWILLSWGFPWTHSKGSKDAWYDTSRTTQSWNQYMSYWKAEPNNIFFVFLLWWGVALGIFLVFYLIVLLISIIRGGRTGFLARTRPLFILLRILELGHLGVCVIGPLAIVKGGASAIVGGILWAVLGLGAPVGLFVLLGFVKDKKDLFKPSFAASCYPFYGAFDFRFRMFIIAPWAKRILIGLFVGFISTSNPLGQLIPITIINLAYLVFVILQRNMFSDYLQRYLEIILAALNLVAFLFLFGFYKTSSGSVASTMGIIFLILQFLAVTISACFFLISWLQLNQVYSVVQCIKFCTCRGEK